ncbi:polysaccharide lyase [Dyadobacter sp. CY326]|uniref:polysaccharide lyase n=1 Tax=Dyadobacter sp. CY326 TaxID=2907300 RepID=UPI001F338E9A|nr:polysaccharide lyase [Dyadobacter sp. CY326]MCE7065089.1 polysaccharide lyase [Dyadobacter sp. CY326]
MPKIFFFILISFAAQAQRKHLLAEYSFDKNVGKWSEMSMHSLSDVKVSNVTARSGKSLKVILNKGKNNRTELGTSPNDSPKEGWFGFSLFFPPSFENDSTPESIVQWQSRPDAGENWRSAPLFLGVMNGYFILDQRTDSTQISNENTVIFKRKTLGSVTKSKWIDFVVHAKWSYKNDGLIEVWKNNKLVFSKSGPNCYNDKLNPYFKIGLYKWDFPASKMKTKVRTINIDEVRIGSSEATYKDVAPGKR